MEKKDSDFINYLRGASILRVVLVHLGLSWFFLPYSSYIGIYISVLFFCSGYIFFQLYQSCDSTSLYLWTRLIGILVPFYILYGIALSAAILLGSHEGLDLTKFFQILIVAPQSADMPYPLGQIWYLRVLIFCTILSAFVFYLADRNVLWFGLPVGVAFMLSLSQSFMPIHKHFVFVGHNLYQEIVYGAYFFVGSYFSQISWRESQKVLSWSAVLALTIAMLLYFFGLVEDLDLAAHAYAPGTYFFVLGFFAIIFCLILARPIEQVVQNIMSLRVLLNYCSTHSYGIYLLHSFFIIFAENQFGWLGLSGNPATAIAKILFVIICSMIFAYPLTLLSKRACKAIVKFSALGSRP